MATIVEIEKLELCDFVLAAQAPDFWFSR